MGNNVETQSQSEREWIVLDEKYESIGTTFLFYGQSGSGKSRLVAQFPNVLILACDPGNLGGALSGRQWKPKVIVIKSYEQLQSLLPKLEKWRREGLFSTLAVDSLSYLQRTIMSSILSRVGRETARFEEWALNAERMRNLINKFADFSSYTVLTATESTTKDEISGKVYGGPNLPGKLSVELPQACDVVCRLYVTASVTPQGRKVKYRFQSTPDDTWVARDRTNTLPPEGETNIEAFQHLFPSPSLEGK